MPTLWKRYLRWLSFRKRRPGRSQAKVLSIVAALLVLDQATKHTLTTQTWAWHEHPASWLIQPTLVTLAFALLLLNDTFRWVGVCIVAGGTGNVLSELLHNAVANPFQAQTGDTIVAFNTADVLLALGMALLPISGVRLLLTLGKEQPA